MNLQLAMIYIITITAEAICIFVLLERGKRNLTTFLFLGCQLSSMLWCISQIGIFLSVNGGQLKTAYTIGNMGICFIGTFWLNFALSFNKWKSRLVLLFTFSISSFFALCILLNPYHLLYYKAIGMDTKQYGFFFYANKYYVYFCVIIGILLIINQQNSKKERMSRRLLSQMVLLPFLLNVLEHFGVIRTSFDVTPLGFSLSCLLVFIAVFRYDFLNVKKKILEEIVEGIRDGIIIFDETGELSFANQEAMNLWEPKLYKNAELFYQLLKQVDGDVERLKEDGECILHMKNRYIQIQMNISKNYFGQVLGISFLLKDITRYYQLLEQTKQTALLEQRLAVEKEQSNIIQKVHDTLGHTLTMIQSLIKLGICEIEGEKREEYLENARGLASNGIRELREYILQNRKEKNGEIITWYLQKLVKTVKETAVELDFSGQDSEKYLVHSETVYECVKEFITNTLRYANATKIQIIVKFMEKEIELYLFDDGIGCKKLICGNGLNGMKNKVEKSRGVIRMNTAENEGFQIFLSLPV